MKIRILAQALCVTGVAALCGCGSSFSGLPSMDVPQTAAVGNLQGSNFGGHAPVSGAHVFVFQVGSSGYGSKVSSLLSASYTGSNQTHQDTFGTAATNPTYGLYYVPTDATGTFNISGDYTCTVGYPVYLFADGGVTQFPYNSNVFNTSQLVVSNVVGSGESQTATFTFTTTTTELFYEGEEVDLTGFTGQFSYLNGVELIVSANNLTTTTFSATGVSTNNAAIAANTVASPSYAVTGIATAYPKGNAAIDNMALLGNCPSTGNFASTISFVYMNEVSTASAAVALAGFADTTVNNDALHIGIPASDTLALQGIENAALAAGNLYDIQGGNLSTTYAGEGHIARAVTPNGGLGTVPQALMDSLGNILAACVDSNNLYSRELNTGTVSPQCATLFGTATADGTTAGTQPYDIATAAINIAHHPAGVSNASFVSTLFNLPTGNVPFMPSLSSPPQDFTVGINYTGTGFGNPVDVAIDAGGNAWVTSSAGYLTTLTPAAAYASGSPIALSSPDYVAVDGAGNALTTSTSNNEVYENLPSGSTMPNTPYLDPGVLIAPVGIANDGNGHTYIANSGGAASLLLGGLLMTNGGGSLFTMSGTGSTATFAQYTTTLLNTGLLYNNVPGVTQIAVDSSGYVWMSGSANLNLPLENPEAIVARLKGSNGATSFTNPVVTSCVLVFCTFLTNAEGIAIDNSGNGWVAFNSSTPTLVKFTPAGVPTQYTGGGLSTPFGVAMDGLSNVWVANKGANTVSKFTSSGTPVTTTSGYTGGTQSGPTNLAVDGSGNVWVVNSSGNSVTELIGVATPVVTPLSAAVESGTLGSRP